MSSRRRRTSRRSPERISLAGAPFLAGAALAAFAGDVEWLVLANLAVGAAVAVLLASSARTTGRLFRLAPRLGVAVVAANAALLVALWALERR